MTGKQNSPQKKLKKKRNEAKRPWWEGKMTRLPTSLERESAGCRSHLRAMLKPSRSVLSPKPAISDQLSEPGGLKVKTIDL